MLSTTLFEHFLTPSPRVVYSHCYFTTPTFEETLFLENSYPTPLPQGSIKDWAFDSTVHDTPEASTIMPFEWIPHYDDICNIIEQMPHAYAESARSIHLMLSIPGEKSPWVVFYHFSKACFHLAQNSRDEVQH